MEYGCARVSTKDQNEQRQIIALREFGVGEKHIFVDKQSGKDFAREQYRRLIRKLKSGDTLAIKSVDRLGRNYEDMRVAHSQYIFVVPLYVETIYKNIWKPPEVKERGGS